MSAFLNWWQFIIALATFALVAGGIFVAWRAPRVTISLRAPTLSLTVVNQRSVPLVISLGLVKRPESHDLCLIGKNEFITIPPHETFSKQWTHNEYSGLIGNTFTLHFDGKDHRYAVEGVDKSA